MTTTSSAHAPARDRASAWHVAGSTLTGLVRRAIRHLEYARAVRALMALDDYALKDIGLDRGAIRGAVYGGGDRPRR
jgi:uncharacterized protein YjiS (DUF1127 family)